MDCAERTAGRWQGIMVDRPNVLNSVSVYLTIFPVSIKRVSFVILTSLRLWTMMAAVLTFHILHIHTERSIKPSAATLHHALPPS